ncbi:MAG: hypothetical protein IT287_02720, partial [Bdellovibrionaceae bacterium]|nr:hypothetical protein [Pseudobdellovibrionaceae bacterium]
KEEGQLFASLAKVYKVQFSLTKDGSVQLLTERGHITLLPAKQASK